MKKIILIDALKVCIAEYARNFLNGRNFKKYWQSNVKYGALHPRIDIWAYILKGESSVEQMGSMQTIENLMTHWNYGRKAIQMAWREELESLKKDCKELEIKSRKEQDTRKLKWSNCGKDRHLAKKCKSRKKIVK